MTTETRLEADSIGTMEVPAEAYYGVQALRAKQNFPITGTKLHPIFIKNLAQVKKAAAITNNNAELLPKEKADAIIKACDEVIAGKLAEEFIVDAIQGGAGKWVTQVRGSRSNVIGLPWDTTQRLLQAAGVPVDAGNEQDGMVAWR